MQDQNQGGQQLLQEMRYNQQPTTSVTNVIVTQPEPASNPLMLTGLQGHRKWTTGLFGCFDDIPMCLLTLCCLPFVECKNASRLEECCCMPYCVPGGTIIVRARLRTIGGIQVSRGALWVMNASIVNIADEVYRRKMERVECGLSGTNVSLQRAEWGLS
ncbi:cornifelin-like isoform X2 [Mizuhopecten yessoensis]|uniref:cornifelin-like isoform X2 n=1 Tax=Mizuhopecten yessoensis TaxID=6573 RepID=UPI000B45BF4E|nr:cornifelin-like isoform X2 [Mizuhopecten yessoensis]